MIEKKRSSQGTLQVLVTPGDVKDSCCERAKASGKTELESLILCEVLISRVDSLPYFSTHAYYASHSLSSIAIFSTYLGPFLASFVLVLSAVLAPSPAVEGLTGLTIPQWIAS